jgi:hypothetical protein
LAPCGYAGLHCRSHATHTTGIVFSRRGKLQWTRPLNNASKRASPEVARRSPVSPPLPGGPGASERQNRGTQRPRYSAHLWRIRSGGVSGPHGSAGSTHYGGLRSTPAQKVSSLRGRSHGAVVREPPDGALPARRAEMVVLDHYHRQAEVWELHQAQHLVRSLRSRCGRGRAARSGCGQRASSRSTRDQSSISRMLRSSGTRK